jgi:hypothetical protein
MQSYLLEVYSRDSRAEFREAVSRLRLAAKAMTREGTPITYRRSMLLPGDETCFHLMEGDSEQAVAEAARRAQVDAARVVEAHTGGERS